jgi:hypothetical protein
MSRRVRALCANLTRFTAAAAVVLLLAPASAQAQSAAAYHPSAAGRAAEQKGLATAKLSDFKEARAQFLEVSKVDPYWPENLYYLGLATSKLPGLELSAAAWFEAYLALEPKSPRAAEIRGAIDRLIQTGRGNAGAVVTSMERMADAFPGDELDASKAHDVLFSDELALLDPGHPGTADYISGDNGVYPPFPGDTSKAWAAAAWLSDKGMNKDSMAQDFASWGRLELTARILGKDEHVYDWFPYIPQLVEGRFLDQFMARTMFEPADVLLAAKLPPQPLCEASVAFGARRFALIDSFNRQEAMRTVSVCAIAAIKSSDESAGPQGTLLADVVEFTLEDGNSIAAWQLYQKLLNPQYGELPASLASNVRELINATQAKWDGKPGAREQIEVAMEKIDFNRQFQAAVAALPARTLPYGTDPYVEQKYEEDQKTWAAAAQPMTFVNMYTEHHGPMLSPRQAADIWEDIARNELSGEWFEHYADQLAALRVHTSPTAIDKAGELFSTCADAAKLLLDGLTRLTTYQRTLVIYRPPAVPLPYTWKKTADAAK